MSAASGLVSRNYKGNIIKAIDKPSLYSGFSDAEVTREGGLVHQDAFQSMKCMSVISNMN